MKKEEILEKSKKENKNKDIYAIQIEAKAANVAGITMLILAAIYFTYEILSGKGTNYALYSLIAIYDAVMYGYKAIKIKQSRGLNIFTAVIWSLLTILLVYQYFRV